MTIAIFVAIAMFVVCLVYLLSVALENSDGHYTPSEASKQAQRDVVKAMKEANK